MALDAFRPMSNGILISCTTVGSAGISPSSAGGMQGARVTNLSTVNAFVLYSLTSTAVATLPSTTNSQPGFWLKGNAEAVLSMPPNAFFSACTTGVGLVAQIGISAGFGIA